MRLGRDGEARQELELAWNNQYQNLPTSNTLKLMDSYKNFQFFETNNTILKLSIKESKGRPYKEVRGSAAVFRIRAEARHRGLREEVSVSS